MRIVHFIGTFLPNRGGTVNRIDKLIRCDGHEHVFITSRRPITFIDSAGEEYNEVHCEDNLETRVFDVFSGKCFSRIINMWRYGAASLRLSYVRLDEGVDCVEGHSPSGMLSGYWYARRQRCPFIYNCHGLLANRFAGGFLNWLLFWVEKYVSRRADRVVVQTKREKDYMVENYGVDETKVSVIYNAVDLNLFSSSNVGVNSSLFEVLYSGYLNDINGVDILLNWIKKFRTDHPEMKIQWTVAGRGPLEPSVKSLADSCADIHFAGFLNTKDVCLRYRQCDVLVIPRPSLPSTENLLPIKLLEAMACGTVVLASDVSAIKDVIRHGENGYLFQKGSYESFAQEIIRLLNVDDLSFVRKSARRTVEEAFSLDRSRADMQTVYETVAQLR